MSILKDAQHRFPSRPRTRALRARALAVTIAALAALNPMPAFASGGGAASTGTAPSASTATSTAGPHRGFVVLKDVDPTILHDIRYRTSHNFVGRPITGYREPLCVLTRPAALALRRAQAALRPRGYSLKVYDCYRPQRAVDDFARWAERTGDVRMKREFYPNVDKSTLFEDGYIAARSGHSRGSTVDLTLVRLPAKAQRPYVPGERLVPCFAPRDERFPDNTIDMGTGFDCFDTLAGTLDPRIKGLARDNRLLLKSTLEAAGFTNYAAEWWHYTLNGEPYPDTYFDFPVARG